MSGFYPTDPGDPRPVPGPLQFTVAANAALTRVIAPNGRQRHGRTNVGAHDAAE